MGITRDQYVPLFVKIIDEAINKYQPNCIVLQCGADSVVQDMLGRFNLSSEGHGECVKHIVDKGYPTVLLGGGGYTINNVARIWTNETAIAIGERLCQQLPQNERSKFFSKNKIYDLRVQEELEEIGEH